MLHFKKGFTIIELLVVITIIAIVSTAIVGGYNRLSTSFKANLAVDNLLSELRLLQSKSGNQSDTCYGITQRDGDFIFVETEFIDKLRLCNTDTTDIQNYSETEKIYLGEVKQNANLVAKEKFLILFYPSDGRAYFPDPALISQDVLSFTIEAERLETPAVIKVSTTGLISNSSDDE